MAARLQHLVIRRARLVLVLSALLVAAAAVVGAGAVGKLQGGGFDDPASESSRARVALEQTFGQQQANLVVLVTAREGADVDDPAVAAEARAVVDRLRGERGVEVLGDYWSAQGPAAQSLRSKNATRALVVAHVDGGPDEAQERVADLSPAFTGTGSALSTQVGGYEQANLDITDRVTADLATAESLAVPLTLALLVVVFGSVVAGLLPLLVGGIAVAGTFAALSVMAEVTDVSVFALNLTTALGLGLAVDYSLLVVSRFREELARGRTTEDAVLATLRTAGRTVLFSSATIAVALSALLVFPLFFLRSFAYAGIAVVAVAALASLVTLPALLTVLGPRVDRLRVGRRSRRGSAVPASSGGWSRLAWLVMRRPVLAATPVVGILLVLGLPFLGVTFGLPDDRVLPADVSQARQVGDVLRADFTSQDSGALPVVLPQVSGGSAADRTAAVVRYAEDLSRVRDVARVDSPAGTVVAGRLVAPAAPGQAEGMTEGAGAFVRVIPAVDPNGAAAEDLVNAVRAVPAPTGTGTGGPLVGGPSAELVDSKATIAAGLLPAIALIAATTFVLLFLFTGSVVLPLKALVINAVSIVGVLGAMVWVFQEGHLSGLLGFTPTPLSLTMPLLMFCVAFGLSMDYEVFLLGRITEQRAAGADTTTAVAVGLERTGRIVTAAAALLAITFFAFVTSSVSFIQMFGLGTGLAIVLDATLVRAVLVPALMRIMGRANWWAPAPLKRLHARIGLREGGADEDGGQVELPGTAQVPEHVPAQVPAQAAPTSPVAPASAG
jgi:RND superfamily putative drug exporter